MPSAGPTQVREPRPAWILAGCTATGKSALAQRIAEATGAAIVSADSMLVYRGMDIGTAKPTPAERGGVPYLGIDLATPAEPFSAGAWLKAVRRQLDALPPPSPDDSRLPGHGLVVVGGTGLYLRALLRGLDSPPSDAASRSAWQSCFAEGGVPALQAALRSQAPEALEALSGSDRINPRRLIRALEKQEAAATPAARGKPQPTIRPCGIVTLSIPTVLLNERIAGRIAAMFDEGLPEEVARLRAAYPTWSSTAAAAIGYAEVAAMLDGAITRDEAMRRIATRTRRLAKRQRTWFRHQLESVPVDASSHDVAALEQAVLAAFSR
jgi:tRNA dimethylallyltransferase